MQHFDVIVRKLFYTHTHTHTHTVNKNVCEYLQILMRKYYIFNQYKQKTYLLRIYISVMQMIDFRFEFFSVP